MKVIARSAAWIRVHLDAEIRYVEVWRSVRHGGDVKTPRSRRMSAIVGYVVQVLEEHRERQAVKAARPGWRENGPVFPSEVGTVQDSHNVPRKFRDALDLVPGIVPQEWTLYELRHSFVSILSEHGLPIEEISRLMGHSGTAVTELVYRHELRPVLEFGGDRDGFGVCATRPGESGDGDAA